MTKLTKQDCKLLLKRRAEDLKRIFEAKNRQVIAVLGSFDTWPYMDYTCRILAQFGHAVTTSLCIYYKNQSGYIERHEREDFYKSLHMESSLRLMIYDESHKAIIIYSVPGAHYIETDWCYKHSKSPTFSTIGIAFVRKVDNDSNCRYLRRIAGLECTQCRASSRRTAWDCIEEDNFCPFMKQGIAKNVIEYYFRRRRMHLYAIERLDLLSSLLQRII